MFALQHHAGYPKLADYLHMSQPGSTVATVSPKSYAAWGMGGSGSDIIVTFSSRNYDCDGDTTPDLTWRGPDGVRVPDLPGGSPECGRFYVESSSSIQYDTDRSPAWMYPLDGNRYTVGRDPEHQGGDVWAADAALKIMRNESDWSGMFLSLPGLDKAAHMWGGIDDPGGPAPMTHMRRAAAVADEQVGRVMGYLRRSGQLDDTLVVLTADHGQQPSRHFHGVDAAGQGDYNWYYGDSANGDYDDPSPELQPLIDTGNVDISFQDGAIRTWLDDRSDDATAETAAVMEELPGVTAVWAREGAALREGVDPRSRRDGRRRVGVVQEHAPDARRHRGRDLRPRPDRDAAGQHVLRRRGRPRRHQPERAADPDRVRRGGHHAGRQQRADPVGRHHADGAGHDGDRRDPPDGRPRLHPLTPPPRSSAQYAQGVLRG